MPGKETDFPVLLSELSQMSMDEMQAHIHEWAVAKGWWEDLERPAGEIFMNIASEVSEAWEDWRVHGQLSDYWVDDASGNAKPEGSAIELADVVIRIMDYLEHEGFSLQRLIATKMLYNHGRGYRHGGKHA